MGTECWALSRSSHAVWQKGQEIRARGTKRLNMGKASMSSEGQDPLPSVAVPHYWGISQQMPPNQEGCLIYFFEPLK